MKKYMLVQSAIEQAIHNGRYKPGQQLPSVREAAAQYSCSISTILRAYAELEKRHAIYAIAQSGYYVVDRSGEEAQSVLSDSIDFTSSMPDVHVFPYQDFQHCLNKAIDAYKHQLFTYGSPNGLEGLRDTLVSQLAGEQVFARKANIVMASGAQQVLEVLARIPFPNGKQTVLVEQPGYDIYLRYLEAEGIPAYGITRTAKGIDLHELEALFREESVKYFYTMPRFHNPLGTTLDKKERKEIARMASKYDVYIVEDDYMADLDQERGYEPIHAYCHTPHVVYLKSFSKIIFPGLRLGAAVLPESLLHPYFTFKSYPDSSLLSQAALEVYIKNGMYERHKHKISAQYAERMQALNEAVQRHDDAAKMEVPSIQAGIYMQVKLPPTVNLDQLEKRLAARQVFIKTGKGYYLSNVREREKFVRISVSRVTLEQIDRGVRILAEEVKRKGGF